MTTIKVLHYEIDYSPKGRLGKGSFGLVYKAKNINTSEMVAVKILDVKELHRNNCYGALFRVEFIWGAFT